MSRRRGPTHASSRCAQHTHRGTAPGRPVLARDARTGWTLPPGAATRLPPRPPGTAAFPAKATRATVLPEGSAARGARARSAALGWEGTGSAQHQSPPPAPRGPGPRRESGSKANIPLCSKLRAARSKITAGTNQSGGGSAPVGLRRDPQPRSPRPAPPACSTRRRRAPSLAAVSTACAPPHRHGPTAPAPPAAPTQPAAGLPTGEGCEKRGRDKPATEPLSAPPSPRLVRTWLHLPAVGSGRAGRHQQPRQDEPERQHLPGLPREAAPRRGAALPRGRRAEPAARNPDGAAPPAPHRPRRGGPGQSPAGPGGLRSAPRPHGGPDSHPAALCRGRGHFVGRRSGYAAPRAASPGAAPAPPAAHPPSPAPGPRPCRGAAHSPQPAAPAARCRAPFPWRGARANCRRCN